MTSTESSPDKARYPAGALAFPHRDLIGIGQLERHEVLFLLDEAEQWVALNRQPTKHEELLSGISLNKKGLSVPTYTAGPLRPVVDHYGYR